MADNTVINAGSGGDTIATDDVAGVKYQRVKLVDGTLDSTAGIPGDATNGLDVDVTRETATAADGGSLPAVQKVIAGFDGTNTQAIITDSSGRLVVVDGGGAISVDDNGTTISIDDGAGSITVDGSVSVSGTVTVDSELTTADLDSGAGTDTRAVVGLVLAKSGGAANISNTDPLPVSDAGGSLSVDDGGGSLTVDGAVSISGSVPVTDNSGSLTVDAPVGTPAFVRLSDGAAAITALPVTDNAGSLTVDNAGTFAVQIAANSSVNVAQVAGTTTDTNSGTKSAGTQRVVLATDQPALTNALKVDGSAVTQPVSGTVTANAGSGPWPVTDNSGSLTVDAPVGTPVFATVTPSTTGGWSKIKYAAQTTTVQTPKGTAGTFGGFYFYNPNASAAYVQVFDAATATTITLGTTVPDMVFGIPATSGAVVEITNGVNMANGIKLAVTTTETGSTAPGTGITVTVFYK